MVEVDGIKYSSIAHASRCYGVDPNTVRNRMKKGLTLKEALETKNGEKHSGKRVVIHDKEFISISEAARFYGISPTSLAKKLRQNYKPEEAVVNEKIVCPVEVQGIKFKCRADAARHYGLKPELVCGRLQNGWTLEEALGLEDRKKKKKYHKGREVVVGGKVFKSMRAACDYYNYDKTVAYASHLLRVNCTPEQIFGLEDIPDYTKKRITVNGIKFKSVAEACRYFGVSRNPDVYVKLNKGYSPEEALGLVKRPIKGKEIVVEGVKYNSVTEACRHYNLISSRVRYRLNHGWTVEEAFELKERVVQ